jgi:hypothetical protein
MNPFDQNNASKAMDAGNNGALPSTPEVQDGAPAKKEPRYLNFAELGEIEATKFNLEQARNLMLKNLNQQNDRIIQQNDEIIRLLRHATQGTPSDPDPAKTAVDPTAGE